MALTARVRPGQGLGAPAWPTRTLWRCWSARWLQARPGTLNVVLDHPFARDSDGLRPRQPAEPRLGGGDRAGRLLADAGSGGGDLRRGHAFRAEEPHYPADQLEPCAVSACETRWAWGMGCD